MREDEFRYLIGLKAGIRLPDLPEVDLRIPLATPYGYAWLPYDPPRLLDDGTWGLEADAWDPEADPVMGGMR